MRTALLLGLAAALLCGCREQKAAERPATDVEIVSARTATYTEYTPSISSIQAFDTVELVARVEGYLQKVNFVEGGKVKKGAVLFQIEPYKYQAEVESAQADLMKAQAQQKNAEIDFERQKTLYSKDAASKRKYDNAVSEKLQAEASTLAAKAKLDNAKLSLSYTKILAPFDGRMSFKKYSEGNLVNSSSGALATITKSGPVKVDFRFNELDMLRLQKHRNNSGRKISEIPILLYFQNGDKYERNGRLAANDNRVSETTGTFNIRAVFDNPKEQLVPGMHVKVMVQTGETPNAVAIPLAAVQSDMKGDYIYIVKSDNTVERREIVCNRDGTTAYVSKGLKNGENVIVEGLTKVRPGLKVNPKTAAAAK